jgi:queuosine biosynthesis protein QueC
MEKVIREILEHLGENPDREGLIDTPKRVVKMWQEIFRGYDPALKPNISVFKNGSDGIVYDQMIVDSALTTGGDVSQSHARLKHLPASFVPNRNAIFITLSHALAQKIGAEILITGVCETDYSGYPDCRAVFIDSIQKTLHLASDTLIYIVTPLMKINKAQTFQLAENVSILDDVIELSHTCYNGDRTHRHDWGYGCGECPACKIRQEGWLQYKTKMAQGYIHK